MKRIGSLSVFTAMIVVLLATGFAFAQDTIVKVAQKAGIGDYLIDGRGMTLYTFAKDTAGKSVCEGPCDETWPLFHKKKVDAQGGGWQWETSGPLLGRTGRNRRHTKACCSTILPGTRSPAINRARGTREGGLCGPLHVRR